MNRHGREASRAKAPRIHAAGGLGSVHHGNRARLPPAALALDGTTEAPHFDRAAFKVRRTYVTLAADGLTANFKFLPEEQEFKCMMAPAAFKPVPGGWGRQGWTTAILSELRVAELKQALEIAWRHALPKRPVR